MLQPLADVQAVPEGAAISLADDSLIAVCQDGNIHLYRNVCPHRGTALNWLPDSFMDADGRLLQCHTHDARFVPDTGQCVAGPCLGAQLTRIEFVIENGQLCVDQQLLDAVQDKSG